MQNVQFQCGHCSKLMAVSDDHLGKQVRCPHCQQIVVAPPPTKPAPLLEETVFHTPPSTGDPEDIFSPSETNDDVFGQPAPSRLEMPLDPFATTLPGDNAFRPPESDSTLSTTLPFAPPPMSEDVPPLFPLSDRQRIGDGGSTEVLPARASGDSWLSGPATEIILSTNSDVPRTPSQSPASASSTHLARSGEAKTPWFMLLVFSPLLLYAIVITIFAVVLYQHEQDVEQRLRQRFEMMPDEGDNRGVQKTKKLSRYKYDPKITILPLPEFLITSLGKPLDVGDLRVTPSRVERKRMKVVVENTKPEPCQNDSLVLYLDMKNLSSEYAFAPLDDYFDRAWHPGQDLLPPFTQLEVGDKHRFYGGPASWFPRGDSKNKREWIQGRMENADLLQPGEEKKDFFVCTDGNDPQTAAVLFGEDSHDAYHGSLLWRVRVRRGLVHFNDKEYPATAVMGVRFSDKEIKDARDAQADAQ